MRKTASSTLCIIAAFLLGSTAFAGQTYEYHFEIGSNPMNQRQQDFHDELMERDPGLNTIQTPEGFIVIMSSSYTPPRGEEVPTGVDPVPAE